MGALSDPSDRSVCTLSGEISKRTPVEEMVYPLTAAPTTPINAAPIATSRSAGVTVSEPLKYVPGIVLLDIGTASAPPLPTGAMLLSSLENNVVGLAIRTTPQREIKPAICSARVKGSLMTKEQTKHAAIGARKVMTVASAIGRYLRESDLYN